MRYRSPEINMCHRSHGRMVNTALVHFAEPVGVHQPTLAMEPTLTMLVIGIYMAHRMAC